MSCEELAQEKADLEQQLEAANELLAATILLISETTDPDEMMALMMILAACYSLIDSINANITLNYWNQILQGCVPDPMMMRAAAIKKLPAKIRDLAKKLPQLKIPE